MTEKLEWSVAGLQCRSLHKDAHLVVINDAAEQSAVVGLLAPIAGKTEQLYFKSKTFSLTHADCVCVLLTANGSKYFIVKYRSHRTRGVA